MKKKTTLLWSNFKKFVRDNYVGFLIGVFASILASFIYRQIELLYFEQITSSRITNLLLLANILVVFITLAIVILIYNKRLLIERFLFDMHGDFLKKSQYFQRKSHFSEEKDALAHELVKQILPNVLEDIINKRIEIVHKSRRNEPVAKINIIIDSGTTLTPIFKHIPKLKVPNGYQKTTRFFTNNIAGVQELLKIDQNEHEFEETCYYLIGGNPLQKYMANTHLDMEERIKTLLPEENDLTISIVTSNWIMLGTGLNNIELCAKGRGHANFKQLILQRSDFVIVVAPLGKLLRVQDIGHLNSLINDERYESFKINKDKRNIMLLTTFRDKKSLSPLKQHSLNLYDLIIRDTYQVDRNYMFAKEIIYFEPTGHEKEILRKELPHSYMDGDNFRKAYNYSYD